MFSVKYCVDMVKNVEETLAKKVLRLPIICNLPTNLGYRPEMYFIGELKADGLKLYQELIGSLRWAVELGIVDILLKTSIFSKYLGKDGGFQKDIHYAKLHCPTQGPD